MLNMAPGSVATIYLLRGRTLDLLPGTSKEYMPQSEARGPMGTGEGRARSRSWFFTEKSVNGLMETERSGRFWGRFI